MPETNQHGRSMEVTATTGPLSDAPPQDGWGTVVVTIEGLGTVVAERNSDGTLMPPYFKWADAACDTVTELVDHA